MFYLYTSLVILLLLAISAFGTLLLVYPKQLQIWLNKKVVMRFNKPYAEAQRRFLEESLWASVGLWMARVGGRS